MYAATLDDYLALVDYGSLRRSHIRGFNQRVSRLAASIPSAASAYFGFELPLARRAEETDFALSLTRRGIEWASRRWSKVARLCAITQRGGVEFPAIWLEFDTSATRGCGEAPSIFVAADRASANAIGTALLAPASRHTLKACVDAAPTEKLQIGFMVHGRRQPTRFCALALDARAVRAFLKAIEWRGNYQAVTAAIDSYAELCDAFGVHVDVGKAIAPEIGLELLYDGPAARHQPDREPRWRDLLRRLVLDELCSETERRALLGWASERRIEAPLVERLVAAATTSPALLLHGTLRRGLAHVKLSFNRDGKAGAKAYYGAVFESG